MNKLPIILALALTFSGSILAQDKVLTSKTTPLSTLEITGNGELKTQPDQTILYIQAFAENSESGRASQQVNAKVSELLKQITEAGFKKNEVKISQFYLNENNRWRNGEMIREGYRASQQLEVSFKNDPVRMEKLSKALQGFSQGITFSFSFTLSDAKQKEVREEVIRKAIQDAREKAAVIARSANIQLAGIHRIQYGNPAGFPQPYAPQEIQENKMMRADEAAFPEAEIKELTISDRVNIIWYIE